MGWYSEISRDVSKIPDAVKYFESELIQARVEVKLKGNLERAAAEMPGIVDIDLISYKRLKLYLTI